MAYLQSLIRAAILASAMASSSSTARDGGISAGSAAPPLLGNTGSPSYASEPANSACSSCHLQDGRGQHTGANLAGLCAEYIVEQVMELGSGRRTSSDQRSVLSASVMASSHQPASDVLDAAAEHFSRLTDVAPIKVMETPVSHQLRASDLDWFQPTAGPVPSSGPQIVEALTLTSAAGDADSRTTAYVPLASVKRGALLALGTSRHLPACQSCHGKALSGLGFVPPLRGRSPSYLARQLWDIKTGRRHGAAVAAMQLVALHLSPKDITDVSSYLGSLTPNGSP